MAAIKANQPRFDPRLKIPADAQSVCARAARQLVQWAPRLTSMPMALASQAVLALLDHDPERRLGMNGVDEILAHPFFAPVANDIREGASTSRPCPHWEEMMLLVCCAGYPDTADGLPGMYAPPPPWPPAVAPLS
jgi:hypothetical protein